MKDLIAWFREPLNRSHRKYELKVAYIITPYVSAATVKKFCTKLKPKKLFLALDENISSAVVEQVAQELEPWKPRIRILSAPGIVHAKLYWLGWKNRITGNIRWVLYFGSCNATSAAFGINAETFAWSRLTSTQRADANSYFQKLRRPRGRVSAVTLDMGRVNIALPSFRFCKHPRKKYSAFFSWLQRGRICHEYQRSGNFGTFRIKLIRPLPPGKTTRIFKKRGLLQGEQTESLTYRYLRSYTGKEVKTGPWRAKYFVDTAYGLWCSDDCFNARHGDFFRNGVKAREWEIQQVLALKGKKGKADQQNAIRRFVKTLASLVDDLDDPHKYLELDSKGNLDSKHYSSRASGQLKRQIAQAKDAVFCDRYTSGLEFPRMPPMRSDPELWMDFVGDICQSLIYEARRGGTYNQLAKILVRENLLVGLAQKSPKASRELVKLLQKEHKWRQFQTSLAGYVSD